jgi:Bifunctional DNA primase/polymerase, N-terminal
MTAPGTLPPLAARALAVLADRTGYPDGRLAALLGITPAELSPVIGLLYRRGLADRCGGYIVASASVPRTNGTSGAPGTRAGQTPDSRFWPAARVPEPPEPSPAARQEDLMPDLSRATLLEAALGCAARGWHVFPLRPGDKRPAFPDHPAGSCTGTDPRCRAGHTGWEPRATTELARIRRAWAHAPYNIGIAAGPSGLVVIDLDTPKPGEAPPLRWPRPGIRDGADVLAALCEDHGEPFPCETFMVRIRRGGLHLYYTAPPGTTPPRPASGSGTPPAPRRAGSAG